MVGSLNLIPKFHFNRKDCYLWVSGVKKFIVVSPRKVVPSNGGGVKPFPVGTRR